MSTVRSVSLRGNHFDDTHAQAIATALLHNDDIGTPTGTTPTAAAALGAEGGTASGAVLQVQVLDLALNRIGDIGCVVIGNALKRNR